MPLRGWDLQDVAVAQADVRFVNLKIAGPLTFVFNALPSQGEAADLQPTCLQELHTEWGDGGG